MGCCCSNAEIIEKDPNIKPREYPYKKYNWKPKAESEFTELPNGAKFVVPNEQNEYIRKWNQSHKNIKLNVRGIDVNKMDELETMEQEFILKNNLNNSFNTLDQSSSSKRLRLNDNGNNNNSNSSRHGNTKSKAANKKVNLNKYFNQKRENQMNNNNNETDNGSINYLSLNDILYNDITFKAKEGMYYSTTISLNNPNGTVLIFFNIFDYKTVKFIKRINSFKNQTYSLYFIIYVPNLTDYSSAETEANINTIPNYHIINTSHLDKCIQLFQLHPTTLSKLFIINKYENKVTFISENQIEYITQDIIEFYVNQPNIIDHRIREFTEIDQFELLVKKLETNLLNKFHNEYHVDVFYQELLNRKYPVHINIKCNKNDKRKDMEQFIQNEIETYSRNRKVFVTFTKNKLKKSKKLKLVLKEIEYQINRKKSLLNLKWNDWKLVSFTQRNNDNKRKIYAINFMFRKGIDGEDNFSDISNRMTHLFYKNKRLSELNAMISMKDSNINTKRNATTMLNDVQLLKSNENKNEFVIGNEINVKNIDIDINTFVIVVHPKSLIEHSSCKNQVHLLQKLLSFFIEHKLQFELILYFNTQIEKDMFENIQKADTFINSLHLHKIKSMYTLIKDKNKSSLYLRLDSLFYITRIAYTNKHELQKEIEYINIVDSDKHFNTIVSYLYNIACRFKDSSNEYNCELEEFKENALVKKVCYEYKHKTKYDVSYKKQVMKVNNCLRMRTSDVVFHVVVDNKDGSDDVKWVKKIIKESKKVNYSNYNSSNCCVYDIAICSNESFFCGECKLQKNEKCLVYLSCGSEGEEKCKECYMKSNDNNNYYQDDA